MLANYAAYKVLRRFREVDCEPPRIVLAALTTPSSVPRRGESRAAWLRPVTFLELLRNASATPHFFQPVRQAVNWRVERPFFAVPGGNGARTACKDRADRDGIQLRREIDRRTHAKPLFITL